jgi:hypothetical protein
MNRNISDHEPSPKSRRELLALGAATAGVLAGAMLKPETAHAHGGPGVDPDVLHLGHGNAAPAGTQLAAGTSIPTLHVTNTAGGTAVTGESAGTPIAGQLAVGVHGLARQATGVIGHSLERLGVLGITDGNPIIGEVVAGISGVAQNANGVVGFSGQRIGVGGHTDGSPLPGEPVAGVHGVAPNAVGVLGFSAQRVGVSGHSDGSSIPGEPVAGVFGSAPRAVGVMGFSEDGVGVQAVNPDGLALDVVGRARFSDTLECAGTMFIRRVTLPVTTGVIPRGRRRLEVVDGSVGPNSLVVLSLTSNPGDGISLSWIEVGAGEFVVHMTDGVVRRTDFRYSVIG